MLALVCRLKSDAIFCNNRIPDLHEMIAIPIELLFIAETFFGLRLGVFFFQNRTAPSNESQ